MIELFFNNVAQFIGIFLFFTFIFILGREFVLWYFKINTGIENQNRIIFLLERLADQRTRNETALKVLLNPEAGKIEKPGQKITETSVNTRKYCAQCGELISNGFPIIISEHGKTKYFCSDNCRINNLET